MSVANWRIRFGLLVMLAGGTALAAAGQRAAGPPPGAPTTTDEYVRYDLGAPATSSFKVSTELSVITAGATVFHDPIAAGTVTQPAATDLMTGQPLTVRIAGADLAVTLARPVPEKGQGRIRVDKTVRSGSAYQMQGGVGTWLVPITAHRGTVVLPAGYEAIGCSVPVQVLSEPDGRVSLSYMAQPTGLAFPAPELGLTIHDLKVLIRAGAQTGPSAAPTPLTNNRSWEPPPAQGPTERTRLSERAHQDRDITYFLLDPATNSFSLFHDYTESRPGTSTYVNVVRTGSKVRNPSAYILDTGEVLKDDILRGEAITAAKVDTGGPVAADTEVVVVHFDPVKPGQSVRLRISETYAAPESYRLEGNDLVFDRSLGRPRNSVVLPAGWYVTALSVPGMISETADHLIRLDFYDGRNASTDVLLKGRRLVK